MSKHLTGAGALAVALVVVWFWWSNSHRSDSEPPVTSPAMAAAPPAKVGEASPAPVDALNSPMSTIQNDVRVLHDLFLQWQTNFPATGNPVGSNAEITAALCGDNALKLDLIARDHPAISARGELCDRWGTPFRFHQASGTDMQIISAGPDRDFATADDMAMP